MPGFPLDFESPAWLLTCLLAIPAGMVAIRCFASMTRARRWSAIVARGVLLALLAMLLAGAVGARRTQRLAVVAVVDMSESVRAYAGNELGDVSGLLARADRAAGTDDLLGVVVFDGARATVASPRRAGLAGRAIDVAPGVEGSDIAGALRHGAALIPGDAAGRIVLISDGVQTSSDALLAASELAGRLGGATGRRTNIPVDVIPLRYRAAGEVVIESLDVPPSARGQTGVKVRVAFNASAPARGVLRLLHEGEPVDINDGAPGTGRELDLAPGRHVEVVEVRLPPGRVHRFEAVWEPAPGSSDRSGANNRASAFTLTADPGSVLLVEGSGESAGHGAMLADSLRGAGMEVAVVGPTGVPEDVLSLQAHDLVILCDVPADEVSSRAQLALVTHVRDLGAGLVMVGGPGSFGAGGWKGSEIEPILPVQLDVPDELIVPTAAMVLVIDCSGSMRAGVMGSSRSQQTIANEAAAMAVRALDSRDLVGVIAFNDSFRVVAPLAPNAAPAQTAEGVLAISPDGGTRLGPALDEAFRQLHDVEAGTRHVIVLSDGRSDGAEELPERASRMRDAGIGVSTISIGDGADRQTMAAIAENGGGRPYVVFNPNLLPSVFLKAVRVVRSPLVREAPFTPLVLPGASTLGEVWPRATTLDGLALTRPRPDPTIINALTTDDGFPVLAHWQVGLGKVAAYTSDASPARWARRFAPTQGFATFWSALARTLARSPDTRDAELTLRADGAWGVLTLDVYDDDGTPLDGLSVDASLYADDGPAGEVRLAQVAPGRYEGRAPLPPGGRVIAIAKPRRAGAPMAPAVSGLSLPLGAEHRSLVSDDGLLREIASRTGGRVLELRSLDGAELFDRAGVPDRVAHVPLVGPLLAGAIVALVLDVATRRVAWDRLLRDEFSTFAAAHSPRAPGAWFSTWKSRRAVAGPAGPAALDERAAGDILAGAAQRRATETLERFRAIREERFGARRAGEPRGSRQAPPVPAPLQTRGADGAQGAPDQPEAGEAPPGDLLAAKRRARERYEGGGGP